MRRLIGAAKVCGVLLALLAATVVIHETALRYRQSAALTISDLPPGVRDNGGVLMIERK